MATIAKLYLYSDQKRDCEDISVRLLRTSKEIKNYETLAIAQVYIGICRGDDDLIDKGLALLELTGETRLLESLREEAENYR